MGSAGCSPAFVRSPIALDARRRFIAGVAALPALALLPGCVTTTPSCPPNAADPGVVDWIPDVAHPVLWGVDAVGPADGAARNLLIYYPSPTLIGPRLLGECLARWPVAIFLHGDPPPGASPTGYHKRWFRTPSTIARCGYVVVVPELGFVDLPSDEAVAAAMADVAYARSTWRGAPWIDQRPSATAVLGHSRGALLASHLAALHPEIGAMVSLSGTYLELTDPIGALEAATVPRLYMYNYDGQIAFDEDLDANIHLWDMLDVSQPKYAVKYSGEHFDYLEPSDSGSAARGPCPEVAGVSGDLAALFLATTIASLTQVPVDLGRPSVTLSASQQLLAEGHLQSLDQVRGDKSCHVALKWNVFGATGSRTVGSPGPLPL